MTRKKTTTRHTGLYFTVDTGPFYRDLLLCFGDTDYLRRTLLKFHGKETVDSIMDSLDFGGNIQGKTVVDTDAAVFLVWMPGVPSTSREVGFLVHELFHATCAVMNMIGAQPSQDSEEVYAYLLGFLSEKVLDKLSITFCACGQGLVSAPMPQGS